MQNNQFLYTIKFSHRPSNKPSNLEIKIVHKENNSDFITISWEGKESSAKNELFKCDIKWHGYKIELNHKTQNFLPVIEIIEKLKINSSTVIQDVVDALEAHNIKWGLHINLTNNQFYSVIVSISEINEGAFIRSGKMFIIPTNQQISLMYRQTFEAMMLSPVCKVKIELIYLARHSFANEVRRPYPPLSPE